MSSVTCLMYRNLLILNFTALPKGASIPSLGLSNKAIYSDAIPDADRHIKDEYPDNYFVPITMEG